MLAGGLPILFLLVGAAAVLAAAIVIVRRRRQVREASKLAAPAGNPRAERLLACSGRDAEDAGSPDVGSDVRTEVAANEPDESAADGSAAILVDAPQHTDGAVQTGEAPIQRSPELRRQTPTELSPSETREPPHVVEDTASAVPEPPRSESVQQVTAEHFPTKEGISLTERTAAVPERTDDRNDDDLVPAADEMPPHPSAEELPLPKDEATDDDGTGARPACEPVQEDHATRAVAPDEPASAPGTPHEKPSHEASPPTPPRRPARHRDRRGARRADSERAAGNRQPDVASPPAVRQAEAKLRLAVDWNRRTTRLSVVLLRPEGFPDRIEAQVGGSEVVHAFDNDRYDDVDIDWTPGFLAAELRFTDSKERLEWLRSARPFHLFAATPGEPDLLSVSAARAGVEHAVICREGDIEAVHAAAAAAGSPLPTAIQGWQSIPTGWAILTGYTPEHTFQSQIDSRLRSLDPGAGTEIRLVGGLAIRIGAYAEGQLPRILVEPMPPGCEVFIGGYPASRDDDGSWIAPGWRAPGSHLVDVVPGPSLTYFVLADPGAGGGWEFWDAHPGLVSERGNAPWTQAAICGGRVYAAGDCTVFACESGQSAIALGVRANVQPLTSRADAPAAVAVLRFRPAFLVTSSGLRRHQGRIIWLGGDTSGKPPRMQRVPDLAWVSAVRAAAARRLAVYPDIDAAKSAWRSAAASARRVRRRKA